jgi:hypothetical protein
MIFSAPTRECQISRVHSSALCTEIGERLRISLGQRQVDMPPNLLLLVEQLRSQLPNWKAFELMKDFSHASFPPDTIKIMTTALESALSTLPHPVGSARVQFVAEAILRSSREGERDPAVLARMALLELIISPRT